MPVIKVTDMAYGRLRSPDLDAQGGVSHPFRDGAGGRGRRHALYMRGTDPAHHIHVTEQGEPGFVGIAYYAASEADLERVAQVPGASGVEDIDEPGGGKRVRLTEPNGYQIEVVWGIQQLPPIPVTREPMNTGTEPLRRAGTLHAAAAGADADPAHRARRDGLAEARGDRAVVPRYARVHLLGRRVRGEPGQPHRLVQPLRPGRRVRRPPRSSSASSTRRRG